MTRTKTSRLYQIPTMLLSEPLQFAVPIAGIQAFSLTRGAVRDDNPYSEVNLCHYTDDKPLHYITCRAQLCEYLHIEPQCLVMPRQTHGNEIAVIDQAFMQLPPDKQQERLQGIDALITPMTGVCIGVNTADCVPIVFAEPHSGLIAVAHAGWRGTVSRIAARVVEQMKAMGANPAQVQATMGPSICQHCFEVGDEVALQFKEAGFDLHRIMHRHRQTGKAHINLQRANAIVLQEAGLLASHISNANKCSHCNPARYFSARHLGINSGRTFTGIINQETILGKHLQSNDNQLKGK